MSRDTTLLHPDMQKRLSETIEACAAAGMNLMITATVRTPEEQDALYAQGRTAPGSIVTNARGIHSMHVWGIAADVARYEDVNRDGVINNLDLWDDSDGWYSRMGAIAKQHGLDWGGDWTDIRDKPHLQLSGYGDTPSAVLIPKYGTPDAFKATWGSGGASVTVTQKTWLERGDEGQAVKTLQGWLVAVGYHLDLDGVYGPLTETAVKAYQRSKGLVVDGVAGVKTNAALAADVAAQSAAAPASGYVAGNIYTIRTAVKVRKGPGTGYGQKSIAELTIDGQKHARKGSNGLAVLAAGTEVTAREIQQDAYGNTWLRIPSGWICAVYQGEVYVD